MRLDRITLPGGVGIVEQALHKASGLRNAMVTVPLTTSSSYFVGSATLANADNFKNIALTAGVNRTPYPQTLTALFDLTVTPVAQTVFLRVRGFDQFGEPIEEVTPPLSLTAVQLQAVYMAKVFSYVSSFEVKGADLDVNDTVSLGFSCDFEYGAVANEIGTDNHGYGTPLHISPYGPNIPFPKGEILTGTVYDLQVAGGQTIPLRDTDITVGLNATGWQGTPHKFGFDAPSGMVKLGGGAPTWDTSHAKIAMMFIRTTLGTQRGVLSGGSYPT